MLPHTVRDDYLLETVALHDTLPGPRSLDLTLDSCLPTVPLRGAEGRGGGEGVWVSVDRRG